MKQIRLDALKLAYREDRPVDTILETAEMFAQYVEHGPATVVKLPTEVDTSHSQKRRKGRGKFNL